MNSIHTARRPSVVNRQARRRALGLATAIVWSLALAANVGRFKLAARAPVVVQLQTEPAAVRLSLDRQPLFDGAYAQTPLKLSIGAGTHKLKIHRDGYVAHLVTVTGDAGDVIKMENVVLQRNPDLPFATVEIQTDKSGPYTVEIDDGLARGETPFQTGEVTIGAEHKLTVYGKDGREPRYVCRFTPQGEDGAEHRVKLLVNKKGQMKAQGCERGRKR